MEEDVQIVGALNITTWCALADNSNDHAGLSLRTPTNSELSRIPIAVRVTNGHTSDIGSYRPGPLSGGCRALHGLNVLVRYKRLTLQCWISKYTGSSLAAFGLAHASFLLVKFTGYRWIAN